MTIKEQIKIPDDKVKQNQADMICTDIMQIYQL